MKAWLDIVGIGEDGVHGLSPSARIALENADTIIGGERHHKLADGIAAERLSWPHPFDALIDEIQARRGTRLVVLATGDPLWFSVGARIAQAISANEITFHPQLSAFQWAAARLGWSLADVECVTAHGRPAEQVIPVFWPGARLLVLTAGAQTPGELARLLADRGYGGSEMTVLGALGGPAETRNEGTAQSWAADDPVSGLPAFNTLAIECRGRPDRLLTRVPGLPDEAFQHDGKITKQEIRALTLARLMPSRAGVLWDLGVGCGSVAIEWMRAAPDARAIGIDNNPKRIAMAHDNALALGAPQLALIEGQLPDAIDLIPAPVGTRADLRKPDAVFIGGGLTEDLATRAWNALSTQGRLVANVVTLESEAVLLALHERMGGTLTRLSVDRASPVGHLTGWRPAMPVTQWALIK